MVLTNFRIPAELKRKLGHLQVEYGYRLGRPLPQATILRFLLEELIRSEELQERMIASLRASPEADTGARVTAE